MRKSDSYAPLITLAIGLTLAVLVLFELYVLREPARIAADTARDQQISASAGKELFGKNCAVCHGKTAEGSEDGPVLYSKQFLGTVDDGTIFSVVSSGVPNTQMPAWNQVHGGPLTDDDVRQLVSYLRSLQPTAPDLTTIEKPGNAQRGTVIFNSTCIVCHGENGNGTDRAPALNNPEHLQQFDDAWYRDTIMSGRPAQGMPTWGTVLSPEQVSDVIALLYAWRNAPATATPAPAAAVTPAATAAKPAAGAVVTPTAAAEEEGPARPSNPGGPGPAISLVGNPASGAQIFADQCQKCHGPEGKGGVTNPGSNDGTIPELNPIDATLLDKDPKVSASNIDLFLEHGSTPEGANPKEKMTAFGDEKKLTPQQIADAIAYVMSLNK